MKKSQKKDKKKLLITEKEFIEELDRFKKERAFSPAEFEDIMHELTELHKIKNHDYAGENYLSNYVSSRRMGIAPWINAVLRLQDKMARLENFSKQGELKVKDESVEDTFKDIAVISILALILYRNKK